MPTTYHSSPRSAAIYFIMCTMLISACNEPGSPTTTDKQTASETQPGIIGSVRSSAERLGNILGDKGEQLQETAKEEVDKLMRMEYLVTEIPATPTTGVPVQKLQEELTKLGAESWDCYNIYDSPTGVRITCRRASQGYLRWVLKRNPLAF